MKKIVFVGFLLLCLGVSAQNESIGPVMHKPNSGSENFKTVRASETFDSTFIYASDTLSLPFFDDFSSSHFQQYEDDYSNPTITSEKKYHLLDLTDVPLPANSRYTSQPTFRRTVDMNELSFEDTPLATDTIKVVDLTSYTNSLSPTTTIVYPPYFIYDTIGFTNPSDTIFITEIEYVQDSATQFFASLNDKNAYWLDSKATHNYTNAVNPWSLGIVTFDGLDENGFPYTFGSTTTDFNDILTSKCVDMSGVDAADSVYFSFLVQSKGFNDIPENGDSLILEFYAPQFDQWNQVWSTGIGALDDFERVHFRIIDNKYFKPDFQFRFRNYSSSAGALDQFHIDYVHLRALSGYQDSLFKDFAIVYPITTLLKDYTQVPWDHYKNSTDNQMSDVFKVTVRNGSNVVENNEDGLLSISYSGAAEGSFVLDKDILSGGVNYDFPQHVYESFHNISTAYEFDRTKTGDYQEFDVKMTAKAQFFHYAPNDTTYYKQCFYDSYAYDDGSAEAAYGPTGTQARLAYQFTPYEADSLVGVKMRFVPSVTDVSNYLFLLTVWDDNNGQPGNVIYEDDFLNPRQPSYVYDDTNGFTNYYLKDFEKLAITGKFYVGWRQLEVYRLNIGMDFNIDQSDKIFYSVDNEQTWKNTVFDGALLMRPIFSTQLNQGLSVTEIEQESRKLHLYPNPTSGQVFIRSESLGFEGVEVMDVQGKILESLDRESTVVDLSTYQSGMYLLRDKETGAVHRIIKK